MDHLTAIEAALAAGPTEAGPLTVSVDDTWPFRIRTVDASGELIFSDDMPAYSTRQKNAAEALSGKHMSDEWRAASIAANGRSVADAKLRAACHPEAIRSLIARLRKAEADARRLRVALRFYARGEHYHVDDDEEFDTVSGEPQNWLCSGLENSETMIEDGSIARAYLRGGTVDWRDGGDDNTPQPIEGECATKEAP